MAPMYHGFTQPSMQCETQWLNLEGVIKQPHVIILPHASVNEYEAMNLCSQVTQIKGCR